MSLADGTPKGIRQVLIERGKWPAKGLKFVCKSEEYSVHHDCCAKMIMKAKPDFQAQLTM